MLINSHNFLTNTKEYLRNQTKINGYDTCHHIQKYNARKCDKDCKELEKSDFAKECRSKNGLFKCCIRYEVATLTQIGYPRAMTKYYFPLRVVRKFWIYLTTISSVFNSIFCKKRPKICGKNYLKL